ncbi:hypothetical protein [Serinibacter arcticus]|uniref:Conjugative transfer protein TrbL n=1 Tax=Serinibacter arcticus TaxID=1655435 RepID=A0A4Z1E390_9MICO|nr:hypothetical protein [Serinibacter arcticus]TGO06565.1 Conjugative transfer protein TrbL [Serinibacter arcticus]
MTTNDAHDPTRVTDGGNGSTYVGPAAPVPPRSRGRDHLAGAGLAVLGTVVALAALVLALGRLTAHDGADAVALLAAVLAGGVLGSVASWAGRSAAAPAVAAGLWSVIGVVGLLPGSLPGDVTRYLPEASIDGVSSQLLLEALLTSGVVLAIGVTFLGLAVAASTARGLGRASERAEQRAHEGGAVTTPPRPRILGHIGAVVLGAVGSVLAVVLLEAFIAEYAVDESPIDSAPVVVALTVLLVGAFLQSFAGGFSSLGPAVAGGVWLVSALSTFRQVTPGPGIVAENVGPVLADLGGLRVPEESLLQAGPVWAFALLLVGGALGVHRARRGGRAAQRQELLHIRSQDEAWSDSTG